MTVSTENPKKIYRMMIKMIQPRPQVTRLIHKNTCIPTHSQ